MKFLHSTFIVRCSSQAPFFVLVLLFLLVGASQAISEETILITRLDAETSNQHRADEYLKVLLGEVEAILNANNSDIKMLSAIEELKEAICGIQEHLYNFPEGFCSYDSALEEARNFAQHNQKNSESYFMVMLFEILGAGFETIGNYEKAAFYYEEKAKHEELILEGIAED